MSSLNIKNLFHDSREVGKTIKSSKKYYVWEFVLNLNYHKVEVFHSKLSGKKKLVLDSKILTETKSYSNDFVYSFKIEKNYFNVVQTASDKFEMRIDNRSFSAIQAEEKFKPREENKVVPQQKPVIPLKQQPNQIISKPNPRNSNAQFFNENDFEFDDSSKPRSQTFQQKAPVINNARPSFVQPSANNNPKTQQNQASVAQKPNTGLLIDFGDADKTESYNNANRNNNALFSQLHFDNANTNQNSNQEAYNHNQQIFNNLNIDFGDDSDEENYANVNNNNNFNPLENNNFQPSPIMPEIGSNVNIGLSPISNPSFNAPVNNINNNYGFNPIQENQGNMGFNLNANQNFVNNPNPNVNQGNLGKSPSNSVPINTANQQFDNNNSNQNQNFNEFNLNEQMKNNNNNNNNQQQNEFKERILGKGLINLDNLLEDNDTSQRRTSQTQHSYNFDLSGPKLQINPNNLENNRNQSPLNMNANNQNQFGMNQGYGMPMQPQQKIMPQPMNNMYMNNPHMGMNMGYPQQPYNNYPQGNAYGNSNMGFNNTQQSNYNYNQNAPQQNRAGNNNQKGSGLDFF